MIVEEVQPVVTKVAVGITVDAEKTVAVVGIALVATSVVIV